MITAGHRDEAALRLAAIVSSSDDAIISQGLDGLLTSWNHAAERLFGCTARDAIGQPARFIVPDELLEEADAAIDRVLRGEPVPAFETVRRRADGRRVPVSINISPIRTTSGTVIGVSTIARDLTDRQLAHRAARWLAAIVESSDDAIVGKDTHGIITSWNPAAERMFGYTAREMVGTSIRRIIPADRQAEDDAVLAQALAGQAVEHFETVRERQDGSLLPVSLSVSPIRDTDGHIIGASKIIRDISERRHAEQERQRLLTQAQERAAQNARLYERVAEAGRLKDEFLATLSHELRTPLNAILGYARMLTTGLITAGGVPRALATIERNASALTQLVEDVLDVSRIISGKIRLAVRPVDLADVASEALDAVRPAADARGIVLETSLPRGEATVTGDADRLQQVAWNLLSNAVKFTGRGGRVRVTVSGDGDHACLSVADTGLGIAPEFLPHVFERFRQADAGTTRERGGLGLGLSIAHHLAQLHGGDVCADSAGLGYGATFRLVLPHSATAGSGAVQGRLAIDAAASLPRMPALQGLRVLAVDDDPDALQLVREILESTGAEVTVASGAVEALRLIGELRPTALVADLAMPHMDGIALIARVRASEDPAIRDVRALALTAYARPEDRARALHAGFTAHLAKPIDPLALMNAVAALV